VDDDYNEGYNSGVLGKSKINGSKKHRWKPYDYKGYIQTAGL
jgi:hypothetical protein